MKDIKPYPHVILRLNTTIGFIEAVYDALGYYDKVIDAYDSVERMHEYYFGKRRYEDYTNFLKARSRYWLRVMGKNK